MINTIKKGFKIIFSIGVLLVIYGLLTLNNNPNDKNLKKYSEFKSDYNITFSENLNDFLFLLTNMEFERKIYIKSLNNLDKCYSNFKEIGSSKECYDSFNVLKIDKNSILLENISF